MKSKKAAVSADLKAAELANKKNKWKLLGKQKMLILMSLPFVLYIIFIIIYVEFCHKRKKNRYFCICYLWLLVSDSNGRPIGYCTTLTFISIRLI